MKRKISNFLYKWLQDENRKPIIIRGARQVGKTWLVRDLAAKTKKKLVEINFEKDPNLASLFHSNDPRTYVVLLVTGTGWFCC